MSAYSLIVCYQPLTNVTCGRHHGSISDSTAQSYQAANAPEACAMTFAKRAQNVPSTNGVKNNCITYYRCNSRIQCGQLAGALRTKQVVPLLFNQHGLILMQGG